MTIPYIRNEPCERCNGNLFYDSEKHRLFCNCKKSITKEVPQTELEMDWRKVR